MKKKHSYQGFYPIIISIVILITYLFNFKTEPKFITKYDLHTEYIEYLESDSNNIKFLITKNDSIVDTNCDELFTDHQCRFRYSGIDTVYYMVEVDDKIYNITESEYFKIKRKTSFYINNNKITLHEQDSI